MNKSKFLKKSLAMLLALMLVLAMIPLSASAVDALPEVTGVWVNDVQATPNGDKAYSAEIVESTKIEVQVQLNSANGGKVAYYVDDLKDESDIEFINGRWVFDLTEADVEAGSFSFTTLYQNDGVAETYNVTITTVDAKGDATVADVRLPGQYDSWSNQDENGEIHYTVVAPYSPRVGRNTVVYVKPTDSDAVVWLKNGSNVQEQKKVTTGEYAGYYPVPVTDYNKRVEFSVIAQNGEQDNYTVTAVEPIPFASFSMKDERHESQISRVTVDPDFQVKEVDGKKVKEPVVELYVPYQYSGNFTPTFETNYGVQVVTNTGVELKSGETYKWSDLVKTDLVRTKDYIIPVVVKYSDGSQENWTLAFDVRTDGNKTEKDTIPAIKSLIVDNFVAEIEGDIITLTIPATVRTTKTLNLDTTSSVSVVGTKLNNNNDLTKIAKVDLSKDQYTLRATAAYHEFDAIDNKAAERDYTLNIVTAEMEEPELVSMILKSEVTGETLEGRIEGSNVYFDNKEGENAIPYRYKSVLTNDSAAETSMEGDDWKLFWAVSDGNTITYKNTAIETSGSGIEEFADFLPSSKNRFSNKAGKEIAVSNGSSTQGYTVWFQSAEASHDSKLTNEVLVARQDEVKEFADLNNRNSEKATVSDTNKTITASIWYNEWNAYTGYGKKGDTYKELGPVFATTLPEGAEIYYVGGDDTTLKELDTLNEVENTVGDTLPTVNWKDPDNNKTYWEYGRDESEPSAKKPLKIVVVSQALAEKVSTTDPDAYNSLQELKDYDNETKPFYTVYELTLVKRAPRTNSTLESLSVYDNYTGTTIDAVKDGNTFTLNLPAYFVDETRKSEDALFLNFTPETGGQTVRADGNRVVTPIALKLDGTVDTDASVQLVYNKSSKSLETFKGNISIAELVVTPESGSTMTSKYTVKVNINDANEAGVLNSVTIADSTATPNGHNVTVNVPFATEVTSLAPEFNPSENAFVLEGTWTLKDLEKLAKNDNDEKDFIVDEGETFNFLTPRTFTVVSESGKQVNTYTITVVPNETFPDVTTDDWFYDEVMTAANKGWITGDNGYFKPDDTMKRGDFALIIARIMNYDPENYPTSGFPDVDSDMYYSAAIAFCKDQGIIGGEGGYFNAEDPITREEMAKILAEALQLTTSIPEKLYADDAEIAQWAKGYVYACQEAGIMEGSGDNFNPRDNATRAEGAAVLVRAFA